MNKERKDAFLIIRVTQEEKNKLVAESKTASKTLSEYLRNIIFND